MALELKMPALSPTMEKGNLAKWLVNVGDLVKPGDLLAEIETDKATMEFEAIEEGRIAELRVPEGSENVAVGTVIAVLGEATEMGLAEQTPSKQPLPSPPDAKQASPAVDASPHSGPLFSTVGEVTVAVTPAKIQSKAEPVATPLARRIASAMGLDLAKIMGTGARGRIVKADLGLQAKAPPLAAVAAGAETAVLSVAPPAGIPVESIKLSAMRKTIARRLTQSKQTVPHFYLTVRCQLDALLKLRGELNAGLASQGIKLSVNDLLIKAMAKAMERVPDANVQFGGDELHRFKRVDIAMAVAIDGGLVTPVIQDAGALSLSAIANLSKNLAAKARDGKLTPEEYQGGTASISNLGMFGIDEMFPVINPPQALILGVAAGIEQPWKVDGDIGLATIMAATASFDHRAIDGAIAAQFMGALRDLIESPILLVC
ncbi:pyruvate dehydrogenase E2 component (dihydrolipoamide acetyltransferase) [Sphingobium xenophagum]|uniref:Dihydrolipoamide acetyltransferase component of pyruvate dehydrogenase complex n=1 Tax=Sphingobium xenophagum TaxID=121428 RepID=A0ABU1WYE5_SPHXE|nr:dihydrolipoamide acetyltransferase family protein [Sphingobium xenophagum]MDR7154341.1 pyruvate dehydrogenase E2 component (dihydrolipoamide acetyltransferase) [Sphingobium xenophagum]